MTEGRTLPQIPRFKNLSSFEGVARWLDLGGVQWQARRGEGWTHTLHFRVGGFWVDAGEHVGRWAVLLGSLERVTERAKQRHGWKLYSPTMRIEA